MNEILKYLDVNASFYAETLLVRCSIAILAQEYKFRLCVADRCTIRGTQRLADHQSGKRRSEADRVTACGRTRRPTLGLIERSIPLRDPILLRLQQGGDVANDADGFNRVIALHCIDDGLVLSPHHLAEHCVLAIQP